jgi:hypothetical protein
MAEEGETMEETTEETMEEEEVHDVCNRSSAPHSQKKQPYSKPHSQKLRVGKSSQSEAKSGITSQSETTVRVYHS